MREKEKCNYYCNRYRYGCDMHNRRSACIESKEKAAAAQFVSETETYSEETEEALFGEETVSETESETTPIVKPVGTTAPVERAAPAIPKN